MYLIKILKKGATVIMPTDTVYGIVCNACKKTSVEKIYNLKNRDFNKPMVILVSDLKMLNKCVSNINSLQKECIEKYWPGPLTIVFEKSKFIPDIVTANTNEIAIRMPDDIFLLNMIKEIKKPIVATSANISNSDTITSIDLLENSIKDNVDFILDVGYINGESSTIIKIIDDKIKIIRDGSISNKIKKDFNDKLI